MFFLFTVGIRGRGKRTISNAEVPFPPPLIKRISYFWVSVAPPLYLLGWAALGRATNPNLTGG